MIETSIKNTIGANTNEAIQDTDSVNKGEQADNENQEARDTISESSSLPSKVKNHPGINLVVHLEAGILEKKKI